ncbi:MAG: ATP-binding protein [bacterium]
MKKLEIEKSIIKKFRKEIWRKFTKAVTDYNLIESGDKVAVCISGGKDSFLLAKCLEEIKKHGKIDFEIEYISMDPGYSKDSSKVILENSKLLGIDLKLFETDIFEVANKLNEKSPCYLCARMRRGYLYDYASKLGCNKIALGHHYDDVVETTMLNVLYNGRYETMLPKLKSKNFEGMELIRPLYLVEEKEIIKWCEFNNLKFIGCACNLKRENSKRAEVKELIEKININNEFAKKNIFKSAENINIDQVLGYKEKDKKTTFLDKY